MGCLWSRGARMKIFPTFPPMYRPWFGYGPVIVGAPWSGRGGSRCLLHRRRLAVGESDVAHGPEKDVLLVDDAHLGAVFGYVHALFLEVVEDGVVDPVLDEFAVFLRV